MRCLPALLLTLLLAATVGADELCLTNNARGQRNLPVAFTVQPDAATVLFDGSHADRLSLGWQNGPITLRFTEAVRVTRATVVVYNDPQRSYNAAGRVRLQGLRAGKVVETGAWAGLDGDAQMLCGTDGALVWGSQADAALPGEAALDSLTLEIEKREGAHQCLLREAVVWGLPERLAAAPATPIRFVAAENTYSSIRVTWDELPAGTAYVRARWRRAGSGTWQTDCFTASPAILRWLPPAARYEVTAAAVGAAAADLGVVFIRPVTLPHPVVRRTLADFWGMNFYPGGGGLHQPRDDESANTLAMVERLRDAGVRHVRWWLPSPGAAELFAEAGLSLLPTATYADPEGYARLTRETGVWLTATSNEPDYQDVFAAAFVSQFREPTAAARRFSPLMTVTGPGIGGEMVGPGGDYLAELYANGLQDAIDVLDLHPYPKRATPTPPGAILGGPESVLASLAACRERMRLAGDGSRPVIATECGHPTYEGDWHMPPSSYERQAQWLVRTHLLLAAAGLDRVYWYAFQDEGTNRAEPEHGFGIIDWHGVTKPAYAAYRTMTRLLSPARCEGLEPALQAPAYALRCALPQGFVTALWDSGGSGELRLGSDSGISALHALGGDALPLPQPTDNGVVLPIDENVRYLFSAKPLHVLGQRRISPPVSAQVQMALTPSTVPTRAGETAGWSVHLSNGFACAVAVTLSTAHPWGGARPQVEIVLAPRGDVDVPMSVEVPATAKSGILSWDITCAYVPHDTTWAPGQFRRALYFVTPPPQQ
jgi:hypothetical protein